MSVQSSWKQSISWGCQASHISGLGIEEPGSGGPGEVARAMDRPTCHPQLQVEHAGQLCCVSRNGQGASQETSEYKDFRFTSHSTFSTLHMYFLWLTLTRNHVEREILETYSCSLAKLKPYKTNDQ